MSKISDTINELKALDLKKATPKEVADLLNNLGGINTLPLSITTDNYIVRSRYFTASEYYDSINIGINIYSHTDLSYNPKPSQSYGRCSIPESQIFYGTLPNDKVNEATFQNALVSSVVEASGLTKNGINNKIEKEAYILLGVWKIHRPLIVLPILNNLNHIAKSPFLADAYKLHKSSIDRFHRQQADDYNVINDFLSEEFSKGVNDSSEYKISALFSNTVMNYDDFDGILYPSVAGEGDGLNFACKKDIIDSKAITPYRAMVFKLTYGNPNRFTQILYCDDLTFGTSIKWNVVPFHS